MFSKDPSELVRKEKMDDEETVRSIRLALVAELDAVNFYLQQSKVMPDGPFKKVHEDIAKEEVTHFGEFMRLLYQYAPEDFRKIREGWAEASALLGESAEFGLEGEKHHEAHREDPKESMKQDMHIDELLGLHLPLFRGNRMALPCQMIRKNSMRCPTFPMVSPLRKALATACLKWRGTGPCIHSGQCC